MNRSWHNFLGQLIRPDVIDATRSWFANLTAAAASIFAMAITAWMYYGAWSAESETLRISFLLTALVFTHLEVLFGIFYLHRVAMKSLDLKGGPVEIDITTHEQQTKATGTAEAVKEVVKEMQ
jgi:TRAP-type C4-dicarboxylate transport system permease small subunit